MIYVELLFVALVVIFVVDLSGFTQSWRGALARILKVRDLKPLRPFDCSLCSTWWICNIYALATGQFTLPVLAYIAALSFMTYPVGQFLTFTREAVLRAISWLLGLLQ